jgi:hypothetical protein
MKQPLNRKQSSAQFIQHRTDTELPERSSIRASYFYRFSPEKARIPDSSSQIPQFKTIFTAETQRTQRSLGPQPKNQKLFTAENAETAEKNAEKKH